jgi:hypothetical protein
MMNEGRVLADGSPQELCSEYGATSLEDVFMRLTGKTFAEGDREDVET